MSHFATLVLLNPDDATTEDARTAAIARLMAPYDENTNVPEYDRECSCIGQVARRAVDDAADATFGTMDDMRKQFREIHAAKEDAGEMADNEREDLWRDFLGPRMDWEKEAIDRHPDRNKPDPTCGYYTGERAEWWPDGAKDGDRYGDGSGCAGLGTVKSTYNPKSKWDYYGVGGRWNGGLGQGRNVAPTASLNGVKPFAVVTPDGQWHERDQMGWWAMVADEKPKDEWEATVRQLLAAHPDTIAVALDCHI